MSEKQRPKKNTGSTAGSSTLSFEASLEELENTIGQLENGDLTLDSSLELFEKGVSLLRTCDAHLKKASGKITELIKGENGAFVEKLLGNSLESFVSKEDTDD